MMTRLQAEESLLAVERTAIGSGVAEKNTRARVLREWKRQASTTRRVAAPASKERIQRAGIKVRTQPRKKKD